MTLGAMCCGDNFCCALTTSRSLTCWGGHKFTVPSGTYKAVACYGKAGVAVDDSDQIASCFGDSGYGSEGCSTGVAVQDVSCGFWGCCAVLPSGSVSCWGASTVYGTNSRPTYSECESQYGASSCSAVAIGLDSLKPVGTYTTVACGGKRAGHFCCVQGASGSASCFGAGSPGAGSDYTPSGAPSTAFHQLACGTDFCCGLSSAGAIQCWGNLNYDSGGGSDIPATLSGPYTQVACGNFAMYALDAAGAITAYGRIFSSSVGPVPAGTSTIGVPSATFGTLPTNGGFGHACAAYVEHDAAITTARAAACWGADYSKQVTNAPMSLVATASTYLYPAALGDFCRPHPFLAVPCCPLPPRDFSLLPNHCPLTHHQDPWHPRPPRPHRHRPTPRSRRTRPQPRSAAVRWALCCSSRRPPRFFVGSLSRRVCHGTSTGLQWSPRGARSAAKAVQGQGRHAREGLSKN